MRIGQAHTSSDTLRLNNEEVLKMNLAIDLPDDVAQLVRNLPDQRGFLIEAIMREFQRRKALAALFKLSEKVSNRHPELTEQQLEDLLRD